MSASASEVGAPGTTACPLKRDADDPEDEEPEDEDDEEESLRADSGGATTAPLQTASAKGECKRGVQKARAAQRACLLAVGMRTGEHAHRRRGEQPLPPLPSVDPPCAPTETLEVASRGWPLCNLWIKKLLSRHSACPTCNHTAVLHS